jgi:hypothetical protein
MLDISRRSLLAGTAAATAAGALLPINATPVAAQTPPVGKQNAGWYRYKVGDHEVTVATDGVNRIGKFPDGFVANKSRDEVNAGLKAAFLQSAPDQIVIPYSPIAVNTDPSSSSSTPAPARPTSSAARVRRASSTAT